MRGKKHCHQPTRGVQSDSFKDQTLRYICAQQYPTWHDIRRFRRTHGEVVQRTLGSVLMRLYVQYVVPFYPELGTNRPSPDLHTQIVAAVAGRIETAIIMDGVEIDV